MMKVAQRLPEHYKSRYKKYANTEFKSPHMIYEDGNWKKIEGTNKIYPMKYFNITPKVIFPPECDRALFAGEGIVTGLAKRHEHATYKVPRTWRPAIIEELFHSEILDRWMLVLITARTAVAIERCGGFDEYIIKTPMEELRSRLGFHLKRDMLMRLADADTLWHDNPTMREELMTKYKDYIISKSEASWIGYSLIEAIYKQMKIEHEAIDRTPLKMKYLNEVADKMKGLSETA